METLSSNSARKIFKKVQKAYTAYLKQQLLPSPSNNIQERRQRAFGPWQNRQKLWVQRTNFLQSDLYRMLPAEFQLEVIY